MRTIFLLVAFTAASLLVAQPNLETVLLPNTTASSFSQPVDITGAGDDSGRLFVVEKRGAIKVYDQTTERVVDDLLLDIRSQVQSSCGECGLLGLAFDPDFATNGHFYVNYNRGSRSTPTTVISRFTVGAGENVVDPATEIEILTLVQPFNNHNAGDLAFGPDGYLYIPLGDGGSGSDPLDNGQDPTNFFGKMLRIDVANASSARGYSIPPDNPFVGDDAVADEIWALGLRNTWRISFDRLTGDLYMADVGQNAREEVNRQPASSTGGENYGWDCREGFISHSGSSSNECIAGSVYTEPLFDYQHGSATGRSITGGFVYRGTTARDLIGYYVCADFASNRFFLMPPAGAGNDDLILQVSAGVTSVSSFGEDDSGNLFVASLNGSVSEVTTTNALPTELVSWSGAPAEKEILLTWEVTAQENVARYSVEKLNSDNEFLEITSVPATTDLSYRYETVDPTPTSGTNTYRLNAIDTDGSQRYSEVIDVRYGTTGTNELSIAPNPNNGSFEMSGFDATSAAVSEADVTLVNGEGRVVTRQRLRITGGKVTLAIADLPAGVYQLVALQGTQRYLGKMLVR